MPFLWYFYGSQCKVCNTTVDDDNMRPGLQCVDPDGWMAGKISGV